MAKRQAQKQAARERAAAVKAAQEAEDRRRRLVIAGATLVVIALVVVGLVVAALNRGDSGTSKAASGAALSAESQKALTSVTPKELDAIGLGLVDNAPKVLKNPKPDNADGKPRILYVGAEYCPFCAGLRWSTAVAMSRFGTWGPLRTTHSADAPEVYPDTATLSFAQAANTKLTSQYIDFVSYETATNTIRNGRYPKLDTMPDADQQHFKELNSPPYVDARNQGAIPFISFGGKAMQAGGIYDTSLLKDKTADQIIAALKNPNDPIAQAILGGANAITAATCVATDNKPADVCTAPGVKAAAAKLGSAG